jgi:hypothetical protein
MPIAELSRVALSAPYATREIGAAPAPSGLSDNALVPVAATAQRSALAGQSRSLSEAPFLTHLIATAEQIPQTRTLRRATPAEAQAAYRSTPQKAAAVIGVRVRQKA